MFPVRDENPHFLPPIVTYGLIALNVAAWVLVQGLGSGEALLSSVCEFGLVPGELLGRVSPGATFPMGSYTCVVDPAPSWITTLTHMFLHGGWFHLIGNMWFLWIFGNNVEDSMGHARFVVFYLLCGLAAAALQVATQPSSIVPMVGASGAIGGVMGAYVMLYPRVRVHMFVFLGFYVTTIAVPAIFMLGYWFLVQLIGGASTFGREEGGGVAFWAHVGGFVAGVALVKLFARPEYLAAHKARHWRPRHVGLRRDRWQ
jgi:membrane associated rhomboid family serine protease